MRGRLVRLDAASARALARPCPAGSRRARRGRGPGAERAAGHRAEAGRPADGADQEPTARSIWSPPTITARAKTSHAACAAMPGWTRALCRPGRQSDFAKLAGKGALAITIEPRRGGKTYQGIVALSPDGIGGLGGNLFRPVRAIAHRDPAGGRAALCGGREAAALARRRHHAADDAGSRQAGAGRQTTATTGSGCRCS